MLAKAKIKPTITTIRCMIKPLMIASSISTPKNIYPAVHPASRVPKLPRPFIGRKFVTTAAEDARILSIKDNFISMDLMTK